MSLGFKFKTLERTALLQKTKQFPQTRQMLSYKA